MNCCSRLCRDAHTFSKHRLRYDRPRPLGAGEFTSYSAPIRLQQLHRAPASTLKPATKQAHLYGSLPLQVHDIDGQDHYRSLGVPLRASTAEIKKVAALKATAASMVELWARVE